MTPRDVVLEEVEHLLGFGDRPRRIAAQLGMQPEAIARALYRADRPDLARAFERIRGPRRTKRSPRPTHPCPGCGGQASRNAAQCRSCTARDRPRRFNGSFAA